MAKAHTPERPKRVVRWANESGTKTAPWLATEAVRVPTKVEKALTYVQAAKDAGAGQDAISLAEHLLEEARAERDKATPPAVTRRRLEQRQR